MHSVSQWLRFDSIRGGYIFPPPLCLFMWVASSFCEWLDFLRLILDFPILILDFLLLILDFLLLILDFPLWFPHLSLWFQTTFHSCPCAPFLSFLQWWQFHMTLCKCRWSQCWPTTVIWAWRNSSTTWCWMSRCRGKISRHWKCKGLNGNTVTSIGKSRSFDDC